MPSVIVMAFSRETFFVTDWPIIWAGKRGISVAQSWNESVRDLSYVIIIVVDTD